MIINVRRIQFGRNYTISEMDYNGVSAHLVEPVVSGIKPGALCAIRPGRYKIFLKIFNGKLLPVLQKGRNAHIFTLKPLLGEFTENSDIGFMDLSSPYATMLTGKYVGGGKVIPQPKDYENLFTQLLISQKRQQPNIINVV